MRKFRELVVRLAQMEDIEALIEYGQTVYPSILRVVFVSSDGQTEWLYVEQVLHLVSVEIESVFEWDEKKEVFTGRFTTDGKQLLTDAIDMPTTFSTAALSKRYLPTHDDIRT